VQDSAKTIVWFLLVNSFIKTLGRVSLSSPKINFENSLMSSNKENKNPSENNKDNNFNKDKTAILDDEEHYKDDNLNYLININA